MKQHQARKSTHDELAARDAELAAAIEDIMKLACMIGVHPLNEYARADAKAITRHWQDYRTQRGTEQHGGDSRSK